MIAKATFAFASEAPMARVKPQPIFEAEVHHAKNPMRSIRHTSDLVPYRKRADIFFTGSAYAPSGASTVTVRFGVASAGQVLFDKRLVVRKKGGASRMPMLYERAVGGIGHPENPLGQAAGSDGCTIVDPADPTRAAGLGPIARAVAARRRLLGGAPFPELGRSPVELPDDFDFDYFQAAPSDQQTPFLRGDEWILLENMNPRAPMLRTLLPGASAVARILGLGSFGIREGLPLAMEADTLHVNGDDETCTVTWRGTFPVPHEDALSAVRIVAGVKLPGAPIVWPNPEELAQAFARGPADEGPEGATARTVDTLTLSDEDEVPDRPVTLPFVASSLGAAAMVAASASARPRSAPPPVGAGDTLNIPGEVEAEEPLPFTTLHVRSPTRDAATRDAQPAPRPRVEPAPAAPPAPRPAERTGVETTQVSPLPRPKTKEEMWGPIAAEAPKAAPPKGAKRPPVTRPPPRVDVMNKLYGPGTKV